MPLGTDDTAIARLLDTAGLSQEDLTAAEVDLTGDAQLLDPIDLTAKLLADVVVARGPDDDSANAAKLLRNISVFAKIAVGEISVCWGAPTNR
jgi:hypothetical protein